MDRASIILAAEETARQVAPASVGNARKVRRLRQPLLVVDKSAPNAVWNHVPVWSIASSNTIYAFGLDRRLRKSTDNGVTWGGATASPPSSGWFNAWGSFFRTSAGSLLTGYTSGTDDFSTTGAALYRSTNEGGAWTSVFTFPTNSRLLGPQSICQDAATGYLYMVEYTVDAASTAANIWRSTDDGATWTVFKAFNGYASGQADRVRHLHSCMYDSVSQRVYFMAGDGEAKAGIYRVNAAGTGVEAVLTNDQTVGTNQATGIGLMFFPNYLVWGMDASAQSYVMRLPRTEIGAATPAVEVGTTRLNSTAWFSKQVATDASQWVVAASNEASTSPAVSPLDGAVHLYLLSDDGATVDEIATIAAETGAGIGSVAPVGSPDVSGALWYRTHNFSQAPFPGGSGAYSFKARVAYGLTPLRKTEQPNWYPPQTVSSGPITVAAGSNAIFASTKCPPKATKLYVFDMGILGTSGTGTPQTEIRNFSTSTSLLVYAGSNYRANIEESPLPLASYTVTASNRVDFRIAETGGANPITAVGFVQFAWGF